ARRYLPGSLMLETTWQTRTGWLIVRDTLCMGPWHNIDERSRTHRRSPTDFDAEHCLLRMVKCVSGAVDVSMTCEPVFDYGRREPAWRYEGPGYGEVVATAPDSPIALRLTTDLRPGIEGRGLNARTRMVEGETHFVALSWSPLPPPRTLDEATVRMQRTSEYWRQWLTLGDFPDHPCPPYLHPTALTPQRPHPQGPDVCADRGAARRRHHVVAGDAARRTQLGLPVRVGAGLDVRAMGVVHARVRPGGQRLLLLHRGRLQGRARPAGHVRRGRRAGAGRGVAAAPVRLRRGVPGTDRQCRVRAKAARCLGRRARLGLPARALPGTVAGVAVAGAQTPGRAGRAALGGARPGHLGGTRRAAALRVE